uniref:Uncharacterized protein n=1 Tax=Arundo donax TaxID=35708 RepID=A0A0A9HL33_ARUDO
MQCRRPWDCPINAGSNQQEARFSSEHTTLRVFPSPSIVTISSRSF